MVAPFHRLAAIAPCTLLVLWGCGGTNHPPDVGYLGQMEVTVGETLSVELVAVDPDGDEITFEVAGAPEGARAEIVPGGAWMFTYSPLASHAGPGGKSYDLVFTASDGRGGATSEPATLTVVPEGSSPVFTGPFAWTLNLAADDHVTALIPVRDDDTAKLDIGLVRGMEGAVFGIVDGHTASMYWKPGPKHIEEGPVFTFTVSASDGTHPVVFADFAVVMVNSEMFGGCPGTPPTAAHEPSGDQHGGGDYALSVTAADAESGVASVRCMWSALNGADDSDMNQVELASSQGDVFNGAISNLSAAAGDGRIVYYHFVATDDDDQTSDYCDHATRIPKSGEFAFAAYDTAHPGACLGDVYGDPQGMAVQLPDGTVPALRLCGGASDEFTRLMVKGEGVAATVRPMSASGPLEVRILDPFGATLAADGRGVWAVAGSDGEYRVRVSPGDSQPVTYELTAAVMDVACTPDAFEPNQTALGASQIGEGTVSATICPADTDYYGFQLQAGHAASLSLEFDTTEADLDLTVYEKGSNVPLRTSASATQTEHLVVETKVAAEFVAMIAADGLDTASYTLDLRVEGQAILCEEDLFAPNQAPGQAPVVFEATWDKLKLCPGKADYLRTDLNGGEELSVWVEVAEGSAPDLSILAADGQTVLASGEIAGEIAMADVVVPGPGPILIRTGPSADQSLSYSLGFSAKDPPGPCMPDRLEPNDTVASSVGVGLPVLTHLTLCPGDRDVFAVKMGAWQTVTAWILNGTVAAHAVLLDKDEQPVAAGSPAQYGEELFFLTPEKGTYYLDLSPASGGQGWYDVAVQAE